MQVFPLCIRGRPFDCGIPNGTIFACGHAAHFHKNISNPLFSLAHVLWVLGYPCGTISRPIQWAPWQKTRGSDLESGRNERDGRVALQSTWKNEPTAWKGRRNSDPSSWTGAGVLQRGPEMQDQKLWTDSHPARKEGTVLRQHGDLLLDTGN